MAISGVGYRTDDAKAVRKALRQHGDDLDDLKAIHLGSAEIVERQAEDVEVARETGRLANSIRSAGTKTKAIVRAGYASVPWAGPVHWGHENRPQGGYVIADPFLTDAYEHRESEVIDHYETGLDELRKAAGL